MAGGNVDAVILALISADKANIQLSFERATAIDLAGRDVLDAVKMSVNPKVINTPLIAAIAKDGIQLKALSGLLAASGRGTWNTVSLRVPPVNVRFLRRRGSNTSSKPSCANRSASPKA